MSTLREDSQWHMENFSLFRNGTENIEDNSETGTGPYEPLRKDSKQTMQTVEQISMWDYKNSLQMHFDAWRRFFSFRAYTY